MTAIITPIDADPSTYARSTRTSKFSAEDVRKAQQSLSLMPIVERLEQWHEQDTGPAGRKADLSFEALLVAMLMLRPENAPQLKTEVANVFTSASPPRLRTCWGSRTSARPTRTSRTGGAGTTARADACSASSTSSNRGRPAVRS